MTLDDQVLQLKKQIEDIKVRKIQVATKLKSLDEEKEALLNECKTLNIDPQKIEEAVQQQEAIVAQEIQELQNLLNTINATRRA